LISDFAFTSIINHERKGYGYATMKVDAFQWVFFGKKDLPQKPNPQVHLVNNIRRKGKASFNELLKFCDNC
jgi:hypothetical protein